MLMSLVFLVAGVSKVIHWEDVEQGLTKMLNQWQIYTEGISFMQETLEFFLPIDFG